MIKTILLVIGIIVALTMLYVFAWSLMAIAAKSDRVIKEIMGRDND